MSELVPIFTAVGCVLYVLYAAQNSREKASEGSGGNLLFPLVPSVRIALKIASWAFAGGAIGCMLDRNPPWITVFFAGMALMSAARPDVIVLTPKGVERQRAWGMLRSRMDWSAVESASEIPGDGTIVIFGKNGKTISHSKYHVDHHRLLTELSSRQIPVNRQGDF